MMSWHIAMPPGGGVHSIGNRATKFRNFNGDNGSRTRDLLPEWQAFAQQMHPFGDRYPRRTASRNARRHVVWNAKDSWFSRSGHRGREQNHLGST